MNEPAHKLPRDERDEPRKIPAWLVVAGGAPLLAAMFVEFASVIGRNTGLPLPGAIEIVQAAVLLSSSAAIVVATLSRSHAKVRVLLARARGTSGTALKTFNAVGGTIFFLALASGSLWIIGDMWGAAEQSELVGIPWLPLRCVAAASMLATALLYARRVIAGSRRR
ncbi:MAG: TRAP transporter small permease [Gammaproteobacteria bacterium]|nr:TRAP transporter small permease [Gammaproteobacteria bacterium]MDH4253545.1 TRAP transporter small permease [Gammaproteobacteria bacterium]MDH5310115.1 TRAP transporter small permease [Gammaproteobacteria bacterium]